MYYSAIILWFDHFLDSEAEICQIFRWFFGKLKKKSEWHSEINWPLQIEKMALSETLKDAENEIETLKETITAKENEVKEAEERCGHLVRLGERRHQELLTSTQQLKAFSDMAKSMLISQVKLVPVLYIKNITKWQFLLKNSGLQIVVKLITRNVTQNQ